MLRGGKRFCRDFLEFFEREKVGRKNCFRLVALTFYLHKNNQVRFDVSLLRNVKLRLLSFAIVGLEFQLIFLLEPGRFPLREATPLYNKGMIIILADASDHRGKKIAQQLTHRGFPFMWVDNSHFPYRYTMTFSTHERSALECIQNPQTGENIPLDRIQAVYYCCRLPFVLLEDEPPEIHFEVLNNIRSAFWSLFHSLDCLIVNPIYPSEHHDFKSHLLKHLHENGIRVPNTLVTNDPKAVQEFYQRQNRSIIFKPPWGQGFCDRMTDEHLTPERLAKLAHSPIMLQELINGQDYRVYVLNNEVFSVEVQSKTLDLNQDFGAKRVAVTLPKEVEDACRRVAALTGLIFTGIDLRITPEGEVVFFEANSSPDFTTDDDWTDYRLASRLTDFLIEGKKPTMALWHP